MRNVGVLEGLPGPRQVVSFKDQHGQKHHREDPSTLVHPHWVNGCLRCFEGQCIGETTCFLLEINDTKVNQLIINVCHCS